MIFSKTNKKALKNIISISLFCFYAIKKNFNQKFFLIALKNKI